MTEREEIEMARSEGYRAGYQCGYIDGKVEESHIQEKIRLKNDSVWKKEMAKIKEGCEKKSLNPL